MYDLVMKVKILRMDFNSTYLKKPRSFIEIKHLVTKLEQKAP